MVGPFGRPLYTVMHAACSAPGPGLSCDWKPPCVICLTQGILRGLDQMTNLIMAECQERVFSSKVRARSALL